VEDPTIIINPPTPDTSVTTSPYTITTLSSSAHPPASSTTAHTANRIDTVPRKLGTVTVDASGVRDAVDNAQDGDTIIWTAGTGVLEQTWDSNGWGNKDKFKAITIQCSDVITKCVIDAMASSSSVRRVLYDIHGSSSTGTAVFIGLKIQGGYHTVS
jgi:hypothetical protein